MTITSATYVIPYVYGLNALNDQFLLPCIRVCRCKGLFVLELPPSTRPMRITLARFSPLPSTCTSSRCPTFFLLKQWKKCALQFHWDHVARSYRNRCRSESAAHRRTLANRPCGQGDIDPGIERRCFKYGQRSVLASSCLSFLTPRLTVARSFYRSNGSDDDHAGQHDDNI